MAFSTDRDPANCRRACSTQGAIIDGWPTPWVIVPPSGMRKAVPESLRSGMVMGTILKGTVAWAQTRRTNGFRGALNGLLQAAKRRARGITRIESIKLVVFMMAGKLDFRARNPHGT